MPRPGSIGAWWIALRPKTLTAAWAPVLVGSACAVAVGGFELWTALAALVGASLIQIGTNFANDVFDFEKGADDETRIGPLRAAQAGLLSPKEIRSGMALVFGLSVLVGLYLVQIGGWPIVIIGVASIASGIAYTGGPYPLGYNGLGDLFVLLFFGFVAVCATAWLQVGSFVPESTTCALGVGSLATAILVVNNVRDVETDAVAGKRTLVVRWGKTAGLYEYALLLGLAFCTPLWLIARHEYGALALIALAPLPLGAALIRGVFRARDGAAFNALLGKTAALLMLYSACLSTALVLGAP